VNRDVNAPFAAADGAVSVGSLFSSSGCAVCSLVVFDGNKYTMPNRHTQSMSQILYPTTIDSLYGVRFPHEANADLDCSQLLTLKLSLLLYNCVKSVSWQLLDSKLFTTEATYFVVA